MGRISIGATLALNSGNFFANVRSARTELDGLRRGATDAVSPLKRLGEGAKAVGKVFAGAAAAGITAMTGLTVKALGAAGELEQNIGGAEAVFGNFANEAWVGVDKFGRAVSETVARAEGTFTDLFDVSANAYKNMGLSQSDYLATANKMGALFKGTGMDTVQALDLTTQAMQRAADVASIMGIDVGAAMESVAGAAKGNFTMMDNLGVAINDTSLKAYAAEKGIKTLGKTMTTQEKVGIAMEMFLEKSAYAAGNYAKENETLAGSITTAKAAFTNFLSGAGDADGIADAFVNVASVVSGKVTELLPTLSTGLSRIMKRLAPKIPEILKSALPGITKGAMSMVNGLAEVIPSFIDTVAQSLPVILPTLISGFSGVLANLTTAVIANAPKLLRGIGAGLTAAFAGTDFSGVGEILGGAVSGLGDALDGILSTAKNVFDFFVNNWGIIAPIIAGIAGAVTAWKVSMMAANAVQAVAIALNRSNSQAIIAMTFSQKLQAIMTGIQTAATTAFNTVQGVMNALFVASPIGWVILTIGALIAVGVLLWMNWDSICSWISGAWEGLKQAAANIWGGISEFFVGIWNGISSAISTAWGGISNFLSGIWEGIKSVAYTVFRIYQFVFLAIVGVVWTILRPIVKVVVSIFNAIKGPAMSIFGGICSWLSGAWQAVLNTFINIGNMIGGFFTGLWNGIANVATMVWGGITTFITGIWGNIVGTATAIFTPIGEFFAGIWTGIQNFIQPLWTSITTFLSGTWNNITGTATSLFTSLKDTLNNIWQGIWSGIKSVINLIIGGINGMVSGVVGGVNSVVDSINSVSGTVGIPAIEKFNAPQIPLLAKGGTIQQAGRVVVGDKGPEFLDLPKGAKVTPLDRSSRTENSININIYADGKSSEEIVNELMPKLKLAMANL